MIRKLDSEIIDVDGYVHVVCGKVICFTSDIYDLSVQSERDALIRLARRLYVDPVYPAIYGKNTVCILTPPHRSDARCASSFYNIDFLKPELQKTIRSVCDAYGG